MEETDPVARARADSRFQGPTAARAIRQLARRTLQWTAVHAFPRPPVFWRVSTTSQTVALTFDDGPHPVCTPIILDCLRDAGAQATFFVIGQEAQRYPDLTRRIVAEGHALGCHTDTHADLSRVGLRTAWRECRLARRRLEELTGVRVRFLRPPWGRMHVTTIPLVLASGMTVALWSQDSLDHRNVAADELVRWSAQLRGTPGEILLLHDDGANTAEALPGILQALNRQGLHCVSLDTLFRRTGVPAGPYRPPHSP